MALNSLSSFLYGFEVTPNNSSIDFQVVSLGPTLQATLTLGFYSLTGLLAEVSRALQAVDNTNTYTATADRTIAGGTQNRVTIASSGAFFRLLFASGPRTASTSAPLLGYTTTDKTGATSYTGQTSAGTYLIPNPVVPRLPGYS